MHDALLQKAKEMKPKTRAALEDELGRSLADEEEVSIMIYTPHDEPRGEVREAAARRLLAHFDEADARGTAPEEEVEAAIQEALRHVKPGYRERE